MPRTKKRSLKTRKEMARVAEYMYALPEDMIATKLGIKIGRVRKYIGEILDDQLMEFKSKDHVELITESYNQYKKINEEGWKLFMLASDTKERVNALGMIKQSQQSMDNLLKMAGIYQEVKVDVSIDMIMDSPAYQQVMSGMMDFLKMMDIDPYRFIEYMDRRASGENPDTIRVVNPEIEKSTTNKKIHDEYEVHRMERKYHREKGYSELALGRKAKNIHDPRYLGADEIHIIEARLLSGDLVMTDEERDEFETIKADYYSTLEDEEKERRKLKDKKDAVYEPSSPDTTNAINANATDAKEDNVDEPDREDTEKEAQELQ